MSQKHRFIYYSQFGILLFLIFIFIFFREWLAVPDFLLLLPVFVSEFALLETERKIGPEKIFYRKSCLMALLDISSVTWFLVYFILDLIKWFTELGAQQHQSSMIVILIYTLLRKIYIYKNFSYEK